MADPAAWVAKAREDLTMARAALALAPPLVDPAAYHCQQCAEKLLKAIIVASGEAPPRTHDLHRLLEAASRSRSDVTLAAAEVADWTAWGVTTRYPEDDPLLPIALEDVRAALATLDRLLFLVATSTGMPPPR